MATCSSLSLERSKPKMSDSAKHTFSAELATDTGSVIAERTVKPDAKNSEKWSSVMKIFR